MTVGPEIRVLLVEDSGTTRKMEIKILNQVGFKNIVEADDGEDAIQRLKEHDDVGLIISDWNMPNKNGYELLVWVRSDEKLKEIPFIMATAQAEKKQSVKAAAAGVSNFITKPFTAAELQSVIEQTFGAKDKRKDAAAEKAVQPRRTASGKARLTAAHLQITDHLTLGVMKHLIQTQKFNPQHFELETQCMPSWNPVQKALETGQVDAAFVLAPIAMDLFSFDVPIRLVLLAHKNGSICVRNKQGRAQESLREFFKGKIFYIPHMLSVHHMLSTMFLREIGLNPGVAGGDPIDVTYEVVPPIKMPEFLAKNADVAGYAVAEPSGSEAVAAGSAERMCLSAELWEHHPCCVVAMRKDFIDAQPDAVQEFVNMLVQSGQFIAEQPETAAEIAVEFFDADKKLGLSVPVLTKVLTEPKGIKTDDLFPVIEDLDRIQRYMKEEMGIGTLIDLEKFADTRFAEIACRDTAGGKHPSVVQDLSRVVSEIIVRDQSTNDAPKTTAQGEPSADTVTPAAPCR